MARQMQPLASPFKAMQRFLVIPWQRRCAPPSYARLPPRRESTSQTELNRPSRFAVRPMIFKRPMSRRPSVPQAIHQASINSLRTFVSSYLTVELPQDPVVLELLPNKSSFITTAHPQVALQLGKRHVAGRELHGSHLSRCRGLAMFNLTAQRQVGFVDSSAILGRAELCQQIPSLDVKRSWKRRDGGG